MISLSARHRIDLALHPRADAPSRVTQVSVKELLDGNTRVFLLGGIPGSNSGYPVLISTARSALSPSGGPYFAKG